MRFVERGGDAAHIGGGMWMQGQQAVKPDDAPGVFSAGRAALVSRISTALKITAIDFVDAGRGATQVFRPYCATASTILKAWQAALVDRHRQTRRYLAHRFVIRALAVGDSSADLDQRAAAWRVAMWIFLAVSIAVGVAFRWVHAALPAAAALLCGCAALILWDAAAELECCDHPHF